MMQQLKSELTKKIPPVFPDLKTMSDSGFIRLPQVKFLYGVSSASVWRFCRNGKIPAPVKLSERVTAWSVGAIKADLAAKAVA